MEFCDTLYLRKSDSFTASASLFFVSHSQTIIMLQPIKRSSSGLSRDLCEKCYRPSNSLSNGKFLGTFPTGLDRQWSSILSEMNASKV